MVATVSSDNRAYFMKHLQILKKFNAIYFPQLSNLPTLYPQEYNKPLLEKPGKFN